MTSWWWERVTDAEVDDADIPSLPPWEHVRLGQPWPTGSLQAPDQGATPEALEGVDGAGIDVSDDAGDAV